MASTSKQSRYMFVAYKEPAVPVQGQKRRRGGAREVRAHITKEFHRKLRVKRLADGSIPDDKKAPDDTPTKGTSGSEPEAQHGPDEGIDQEETRPETVAPEQFFSSQQEHSRPPTVGSPGTRSVEDSRLPRRRPRREPLPGLKQVLGEGRTDPFDALPIRKMSTYLHMVLDHALTFSWPNTVPVKCRDRNSNPVKREWLQCAMQWPVVFHAFIYATTLHLLCVYQGRELIHSAPVMRLQHKGQVIKLLNEHLRHLEGPPMDALIMSIAILAIHGEYDATVYPEIHPVSPLAKAQNLHVYGSMINDEQHVHAILMLIMRKGGLDAMELFGMADTMALCDLFFATKHVRRPIFPLRRPPQSLVLSGRHKLDATAIEMDSQLGSGFKYFRFFANGSELLSVLELWFDVTIALDHYIRRGPTAPDFVDLVEARTASQHSLLSQLPEILETDNPEFCVLHATRLATLVYGDMVIIPLPPTQRVKAGLSSRLFKILQACEELCCWDLHGQVLLWALTLGAIAASHMPARELYVQQLRKYVSALEVKDWPALETICLKHLWWKPVCSPAGQKLWGELFPSDQISSEGG
ncbi:hypothetical protein PV08_05581 [Exophiala spinifera]|uniref:Transcription factor domain-containing protein n=1 Tax=Exophiala spinifera TaxID=91928 RepID=A0A0D2B9E1_9EURO|nr:uncharacterized protein PV08_05581 [Exophiala spinifera]KIW15533.1 hypothetical protein PV08_05581 [Exophiala spinifera]